MQKYVLKILNKNSLEIKTSTWNKDSTELLDYESEDVLRTNLLTRTDSLFIKKENTIISIKSKQEMDKTDTFLFKINVKNNNFYLNALTNQPEEKDKMNISLLLSDMAWFIIKRFKNKNLEDVKLLSFYLIY
jgi:hypothetical protein